MALNRGRWVVPGLLTLALLPGCGQVADATRVLKDAATATAGLHTVQVDVKFGSGAVILGQDVVSAKSKVKLPSDSDSTVILKNGDTEFIVVGGHVYASTLGFFSELSAADAAAIPDPARLFDPVHGLPAALTSGRGAAVTGSESVDGKDCDRVGAVYSAAQVGDLLGFSPAGDVDATFWIGRGDHLVRRARLAGHLYSTSDTTQLEVHLHDFNGPIEIRRPA